MMFLEILKISSISKDLTRCYIQMPNICWPTKSLWNIMHLLFPNTARKELKQLYCITSSSSFRITGLSLYRYNIWYFSIMACTRSNDTNSFEICITWFTHRYNYFQHLGIFIWIASVRLPLQALDVFIT